MTQIPTFFYQMLATPPKGTLDVVEFVADFQGSGPQVPPEFFREPDPYFLGGIAAQLDPLPIEPTIVVHTGAFATTQHYPMSMFEHPSVSHIFMALEMPEGADIFIPAITLAPNKVYWIIKYGWLVALLVYGVFI